MKLLFYMKIERYIDILYSCLKMNSRDILIKLFKIILFELCSYFIFGIVILVLLLLIFFILNLFICV